MIAILILVGMDYPLILQSVIFVYDPNEYDDFLLLRYQTHHMQLPLIVVLEITVLRSIHELQVSFLRILRDKVDG